MAAEPVERREVVLYCSICGRRMVIYTSKSEVEVRIRYWRCPKCGPGCTGKTVEISEEWRRH